MGFGRKTIEIITENPIKAQEEIKQDSKERGIEIVKVIMGTAIEVFRIIKGR